MSTLAIVTVCRNDRAGLERTLTSLNEQSWQGFAHHVVDGASSDGSAEPVSYTHLTLPTSDLV